MTFKINEIVEKHENEDFVKEEFELYSDDCRIATLIYCFQKSTNFSSAGINFKDWGFSLRYYDGNLEGFLLEKTGSRLHSSKNYLQDIVNNLNSNLSKGDILTRLSFVRQYLLSRVEPEIQRPYESFLQLNSIKELVK